jgi:sporulation protein YlmC with PRC-barrel domain
MLTKYLAAALIGSALLAAPALAQNTPQNAPKSDKSASAQAASATGLWQGSKLIGLNVYNNNNEKVGDIKELMVDKSGKIDSVAIAVGGFLGMGEHDVAVKFSELKWVDEPVSSTSTSSSSNARPGGSTATTGATTASSKRNYPDHAMLNATKDQLKAMPQFDYNK